MSPCRRAVTELELFDKTPAGWKVGAAGCKPEGGEEQPDDCELES